MSSVFDRNHSEYAREKHLAHLWEFWCQSGWAPSASVLQPQQVESVSYRCLLWLYHNRWGEDIHTWMPEERISCGVKPNSIWKRLPYWGSRRHLSLAGLLWEHFQEVQPSQKSAASHSHSRETDGALSKDAHKCIFLYAFLEYGQRYAIKGWQRVKGSVEEAVMDLKDELAKSFQERWTKVHKCDRPGCETCLIIDMESIKVHPLQWQLPSWKISWEWRKSSKKTRCRRSWAKEQGCTSISFQESYRKRMCSKTWSLQDRRP